MATKTTTKKATKKAKPESKEKRLSAVDAAAKVLASAKEPMNCQSLIDAMAAKKLWSSPGGKTPASTLNAAIAREIATKGGEGRFKKVDRGQFVSA